MRGLKTIRDSALIGAALDEVQARRSTEKMAVKNIMIQTSREIRREVLDGSVWREREGVGK